MATYGTDLVLLATGSDGSGGTWDEFVGWDGGGAPGSETENFIQGAASISQTFGNPTTGKSIAFDASSDISSSIPSGDVVIGWVFMGAATNMYSYASGGHRFGIGASLTNFDMWYISGDDRPPNPYGGWWNVAVDPRHATDATGGTGSSGAWRWFGSLIGDSTLGIRVKIGKGNPHAVDGLLMGRGEIYCTGTGATFTLMSAQNDLVANRWGLLQDTGGGTFLGKGLQSWGQAGTAVTLTDANKTIVIDDCPKTYLAFNRIEVNHEDTVVTLTNVSFTSRGTFSPGQFEMIDNATVVFDGCTFNSMDAFLFLSNGDAEDSKFVSCKMITAGGGLFNGAKVLTSTVAADASAFSWNIATDPDGYMDNMAFSKGTNEHHAITFGSLTPSPINLNGINFQNFNASDGNNASALYFPDTGSDVDWVVNATGCTGNVKYKKVRAGDTVTVNLDQVSHTLSGLINASEVTYTKRGAAIDTGSDGSTTVGSRNFVTTNSWGVDAYKGHLLEITSGADVGRYYVSGNSATTLYLDAEMTATAGTLTWELYDENDDTEVFHVESVTGNQSQYTYTYAGDVVVDIMIQHVDYEEIVLEKITLGNSSQSQPQTQRLDVNYYNP